MYRKDIVKYTRSLIVTMAIFACFSQALLGITPPTLPGNFEQLPLEIQQEIVSKLSDSDLARLAQTSKQARQVLEDELKRRRLEAVREQWLLENIIKINFSGKLLSSTTAQFERAVLNELEKTAQQYPGQLISLNLSRNQLIFMVFYLKTFIQSIAEFPIVKLDLSINMLRSLPEGIFNNLPNLQWLILERNDLQFLPENIFNGLHKLQWLDLSYNKLSSLPENIFNKLHNLKWLNLHGNQLSDTEKQKIRKALPRRVRISF